ncbi:MAG: hypothetical protein IJP24_00890 [Firmicutes bacterium]|nr:hypothetical protein [Bacillota bacterium]
MAFYDWNGNGRSDHFDNYIEMKVSSPSRSSGNVSSGTPGNRSANSSGSGTSTTPGGGTKSTQDSISDLTSTGCIFIFIALVLAGARIIGPLILLLIEETAMFVANSPAAVIAILFIIIAIAALKLLKS